MAARVSKSLALIRSNLLAASRPSLATGLERVRLWVDRQGTTNSSWQHDMFFGWSVG